MLSRKFGAEYAEIVVTLDACADKLDKTAVAEPLLDEVGYDAMATTPTMSCYDL